MCCLSSIYQCIILFKYLNISTSKLYFPVPSPPFIELYEKKGTFSTLDGPPSNLRPTRPRPFHSTQSQFKQSRGVVLAPTAARPTCDSPSVYNAEEIYLSARLVIVCGEQAPNVPPALIEAGLRTLPNVNDGSSSSSADIDPSVVVVPNVATSAYSSNALVVDGNCRTSHPDVFACGGCAAFAIQPGIKMNYGSSSSRPGTSSSNRPSSRQSTSRPGTSQSRKGKSRVAEPLLVSHLTSVENITAMARFVVFERERHLYVTPSTHMLFVSFSCMRFLYRQFSFHLIIIYLSLLLLL
jgi:hypothetical protein